MLLISEKGFLWMGSRVNGDSGDPAEWGTGKLDGLLPEGTGIFSEGVDVMVAVGRN